MYRGRTSVEFVSHRSIIYYVMVFSWYIGIPILTKIGCYVYYYLFSISQSTTKSYKYIIHERVMSFNTFLLATADIIKTILVAVPQDSLTYVARFLSYRFDWISFFGGGGSAPAPPHERYPDCNFIHIKLTLAHFVWCDTYWSWPI